MKEKEIQGETLLKGDLKLLVSHYKQEKDSPVKESAHKLKQQYENKTRCCIMFEHQEEQQEIHRKHVELREQVN